MLILKPTCENCNRALPGDTGEAMICSYECTFCRDCVDSVLAGVCPNCGGEFCPRPIRPGIDLINGNYLGNHPASTTVVHNPVDEALHRAFLEKLGRNANKTS